MIDTHVHLTGSELWPDRKAVMDHCAEVNVRGLVNICLSGEELKRSEELQSNDLVIVHAAAVHPTKENEDAYFDKIATAASQGKLVAIGETGLDYVRSMISPQVQAERFSRHMELALAARLPLIIHCRGAFEDLILQLQRSYLTDSMAMPGLIHCFSEGPKELSVLLNMGWLVGFGGLVTYPKAPQVQRAATLCPDQSYVLETDSPYLTPMARKKMRNEPGFVPLIAEHLSQLRGESLDQISLSTTANARRLFPALDRLLKS